VNCLKNFEQIFHKDVLESQDVTQLFNMAASLYQKKERYFKEQSDLEEVAALNFYYQHIKNLCSFLHLTSRYSFVMNPLQEEAATIPYKLLSMSVQSSQLYIQETKEALFNLKETLECEFAAKVKISSQLRAKGEEILRLIEKFRLLARRYFVNLKQAEKQLSLMLDQGLSTSLAEQLKYFSLIGSMHGNSLPLQETLRQLDKLYFGINPAYDDSKQKENKRSRLVSLVPMIYKDFLEKWLRGLIPQLNLSESEWAKKTTIKPIRVLLAYAAETLKNELPREDLRKRSHFFANEHGLVWFKVAVLFIGHMNGLKRHFYQGKDTQERQLAAERCVQDCAFILKEASRLSPAIFNQMFGPEEEVEFRQIKLQIVKGFSKLALFQSNIYQRELDEVQSINGLIEAGSLTLKKSAYILESFYQCYVPFFKRIQEPLQKSQLEIQQLKAEYFFKLENRELTQSKKKVGRRQIASKTAEKMDAFKPFFKPLAADELEDPLKSMALAAPKKGAKGRKGLKAMPQVQSERSFSTLLNLGSGHKILSVDQQPRIYRQDATFHFNHFLRAFELMQLLQKEGGLTQALLSSVIYHLGLANEQALTPVYLQKFSAEELTHDLTAMASFCQTAASQLEPLNQASIAFRYPYEQAKRLQWIGQKAPLGLHLILSPPKNMQKMQVQSKIDQMVQGGVHHFTACLNTPSLKPLVGKIETAFQQLFPLPDLKEQAAQAFAERQKRELEAALHFIERKLTPIEQQLHKMAEQAGEIGDLFKTISYHLKSFRELLALASLFPHQRFLSFFQGALLLRGQYALENSARLIALLQGEDWRSHSLKAYSQAFQIEEVLEPESQQLWKLIDLKKALDYPFWHLSKMEEGSGDKNQFLLSLYQNYQLSLAALDGEGFIPSQAKESDSEQAYPSLAAFSKQMAKLIEEVLQKKVF
ncbi:MAG: hypothetical protein K0S07_286, partial [Chlamydiales bacterium]|jgi:hypothetical protein|nr:hypothetical protein [Chlamydiales bacterium]